MLWHLQAFFSDCLVREGVREIAGVRERGEGERYLKFGILFGHIGKHSVLLTLVREGVSEREWGSK